MCSLRVTKKKPKHQNKTKPKKLKKGALNTSLSRYGSQNNSKQGRMSTPISPQISKCIYISYILLFITGIIAYYVPHQSLSSNFPHGLSQQTLSDKDQLIGRSIPFRFDHDKPHHKKKRKVLPMVSNINFLQNNKYSLIIDFKELIIPNYHSTPQFVLDLWWSVFQYCFCKVFSRHRKHKTHGSISPVRTSVYFHTVFFLFLYLYSCDYSAYIIFYLVILTLYYDVFQNNKIFFIIARPAYILSNKCTIIYITTSICNDEDLYIKINSLFCIIFSGQILRNRSLNQMN